MAVTLTMNGKEITVEDGMTLLDAARDGFVSDVDCCASQFVPRSEGCREVARVNESNTLGVCHVAKRDGRWKYEKWYISMSF